MTTKPEADDAIDAIEGIKTSGESLALCVSAEMESEAVRPLRKVDAIRRIMQTTNDDTGKQHSASSAEKVVEADEEYAAFLREHRHLVADTIMARAKYEAAKRYADLALLLAGVAK